MNPWDYHNKLFMNDIRLFFQSLHKGPRERNIGDGVVRDPNTSFHIKDLVLDPDKPDHLKHVNNEYLPFFACSMTYVVLINQMIHSHFKCLYNPFYNLTRYPLVAGGMNPTRSPYAVLSDEIWQTREISQTQLSDAWKDLVEHLHEDIEVFCTEQARELGLTWDNFKNAALKDSDVVGPEPWGKILSAVIQ